MKKIMEIKTNVRRRLEYIEFQLAWEGSVGRRKLQEQFSISMQQATKDLNSYIDNCPDNIKYDPRKKAYLPSNTFSPVLIEGKAVEYFMQLEMLHNKYRDENEIWIENIPSFDLVSGISRPIHSETLRSVLEAIQTKGWIETKYYSLSSENIEPRVLFPHALAGDGHRWHMRAYDLSNERYSDFVLSRIKFCKNIKSPEIEIPDDYSWNNEINLILSIDQSLSQRKRNQLEFEYGMDHGKLSLEVKQAMLFYYLRYYGFNPFETENNMIKNQSSYSLKIVNLNEIEQCIGRRN